MESSIIITKEHSVFISYSWDSEEHIRWIVKLADMIRKSGVQVVTDQTDFVLGDPLPRMMEDAIIKCEYVLFVCTPNYKTKSDSHLGGVTYEDTIITGEIYEKQNHRKYIPIFIDNDISNSLPNWAKGKLGVVFDNRKLTRKNAEKLIKTIGGNINALELNNFFDDREIKDPLSFYSLTPTLQTILLSNIRRMLEQIDKEEPLEFGGSFDEVLFILDSIDSDKLTSKVQKLLKDTIEDLEGYYKATVIYDDISYNPALP